MRVITINRSKPTTILEFYGCPMHCKYCTHMVREKKDYTLEQMKKILLDYDTKTIFMGGAEPAQQGKELLPLIKLMNKSGKEIILKTTGHDPDFLREVLPFVNKFILEVKVPLDDASGLASLTRYDEEQSRAHLIRMREAMEVIKGKDVTATIRIIPGYYDEPIMERIGVDLKDVATEAHITQFLSSSYDLPFDEIFEPSPSEDEMMRLGAALRKQVLKVKVKGNGFDHWL